MPRVDLTFLPLPLLSGGTLPLRSSIVERYVLGSLSHNGVAVPQRPLLRPLTLLSRSCFD